MLLMVDLFSPRVLNRLVLVPELAVGQIEARVASAIDTKSDASLWEMCSRRQPATLASKILLHCQTHFL